MRISFNKNYFVLNHIRNNTSKIYKSNEKLSSGLRINSAADNAASLSISQRMRARIRGLHQANRNIQDGISLITVAENALAEIGEQLQRIRELSLMMSNDTYNKKDKKNAQIEIEQIKESINAIANNTEFNNISLLNVKRHTSKNTYLQGFNSSNKNVAITDTLLNKEDWSHQLEVIQLLDTKQVKSQKFSSITQSLGLSGNFDIDNITIHIEKNDSLTDIKDKINNSSSNVLATIDKDNHLVISSTVEGADGDFSLRDNTDNVQNLSSSDSSIAEAIQLFSENNWSQSINISQIAQAMTARSDKVPSHTSPLNLNGQFKVNDTIISIDNNDSLLDIRNKINDANIDVNATIDDSYRLIITSNKTGESNAFTLEDLTTDGSYLVSSNPDVASTKEILSNTVWSHELEVEQLAGTHTVRSDAVDDINKSLGYSGKFTINDHQFTVKDNDSLVDIKNMINEKNINVIANINDNNQLILESDISGTEGAIIAKDDTENQTSFSDDFSSGELSSDDYTIINGDWVVSDGILEQSAQDSPNSVLLINGTDNFPAERTITIDILDSDHRAGGYLSYTDEENYTQFTIDNQYIYLSKWVNGIKDEVRYYHKQGMQSTLMASTDGQGNYTVKAWSEDGELLGEIIQEGWTDADTDGKMGIAALYNVASFDNLSISSITYSEGSEINNLSTSQESGTSQNMSEHAVLENLNILNSSGAFTNVIEEAQDAKFTIDGNHFSSSSNSDINIEEKATIDLIGTGNTTISNENTNAILYNIGLLQDSQINIIQKAMNAKYTTNDIEYSSNENLITLFNDEDIELAKILLKNTGDVTISNTSNNTILRSLGILDIEGNYIRQTGQAQDTKYTVNEQAYTSKSNNVNIQGDATINLLGTGSATIYNNTSQKENNDNMQDNKLLINVNGRSANFEIHLSNVTIEALGLENISLENRNSVEKLLKIVDNAQARINSERAKYGIYQNALFHISRNAENYSENLISAESRIRDLDMAKEIVNFTRNKILLDTSISLLAHMNQNADSVLKLLSIN
ncbi:flagellin N-terminal helical domain-containing protein [Natronospora cellulosivora (SeqCode)]